MRLIRNAFILLLVFALGAVASHFMANRQAPAYAKPEVNPAIIAYLEASLNHDWDRLLPLLQGEALINAEANMGDVPAGSAGGSLIETRLVASSVAGQYEIADVISVTATFTPHGDERHINAYRFYLINDKIFTVRFAAFPLNEKKPAAPGHLAEATVIEYMDLIEKNEWDKALRLLVGKARLSARDSVARMPDDMAFSFKDLQLATIGKNEDTALVEARYVADDGPMKLLFELKNVSGTWLIESLALVE